MTKKITFVFNDVLNGTVQAQEFLDIILMAAAFDLAVSVVFIGDGAYALLNNQNTEQIGTKNVLPVMQALSIYDISNIFVDEQALQQRGLSVRQLIPQVSALSSAKVQLEVSTADQVFSF